MNAIVRRRFLAGAAWLGSARTLPAGAAGHDSPYLATSNGWYVQNGKPIWGYARANEMWGGYRGQPTGWWTDYELGPSLIRNDPGRPGPNRTEDLDRLTDAMLAYGYPGFEHCPPLWYDRRRDAHDVVRREDPNAVAPFLEMTRSKRKSSGSIGTSAAGADSTMRGWVCGRLAAPARATTISNITAQPG